MLEKMSDFFESRLDTYDEHMRKNIESADEFYPFTARCLPKENGSRVLDLGCGTGLELEEYYRLNPTAEVTGIDLSRRMLESLKRKFPDRKIQLVCGSYFDVPFDKATFDGAVSVESLHHFTKEEKIPLYAKLYGSLKQNGYFILTDYFALTEDEERLHRKNFEVLKKDQGISDGEFYHYDTPLTVEHEMEALYTAGFSSVTVLKNWGATFTLVAKKEASVEHQCVLNITNGDAFNDFFLTEYREYAIPFCEDMMDGECCARIFSDEFIKKRCFSLGVSEYEYRSKMQVYDTLTSKAEGYSALHLWFGRDCFCQMNLLTLLAFLEEIGYNNKITLSYIDDEDFKVISEEITVELGGYKELYGEVLVSGKRGGAFGVILGEALDLYFDYHSDDGFLARTIRGNSSSDEYTLLCLLLNISREYGLSDIQAKRLIGKYRSR